MDWMTPLFWHFRRLKFEFCPIPFWMLAGFLSSLQNQHVWKMRSCAHVGVFSAEIHAGGGQNVPLSKALEIEMSIFSDAFERI